VTVERLTAENRLMLWPARCGPRTSARWQSWTVSGSSRRTADSGSRLHELLGRADFIFEPHRQRLLSVGAMSYAGHFNAMVVADGDGYPDIDKFMTAARSELKALAEAQVSRSST